MPTIEYDEANGKFHLKLSIRYNADADEILRWQASFEHASKILRHATDNQIQFGRISICNNSGDGYFADAWLEEESGRSHGGATITLYGDERFHPYIIIHEIGHYAFKLEEEYKSPGGADYSSNCSDDASSHRCIMEFGANDGDQIDPDDGSILYGDVREFCDGTNHNPGSPNPSMQQHHKGMSCWNWILETDHEKFKDLTIPVAGRAFDASGHEAITWVVKNSQQRYVVIYDNSVSMLDTPALAGIRNATRLLIDLIAIGKESFGLESSDGEFLFDLRQLDNDNDRQAAINALNNAPAVAIPDNSQSLLRALQHYQQLGTPSANQTVLLFRSGPNSDSQVANLITGYRQQGVRVHTVAFDQTIQSVPLENLSDSTEGLLEYIPAKPGEPIAIQAAQDTVATFWSHLVDNGGLLARDTFVIPEWPGRLPDVKVRSGVALPAHVPVGQGLDRAVVVEKHCRRVTFILNSLALNGLKFVLIGPDGQAISPDGQQVTFFENPELGYAYFSVSQPDAGSWILRFLRTRPDIPDLVGTAVVVAENPDLHIWFDASQQTDSTVIRFESWFWYTGWLAGLAPPVVELFKPVLPETSRAPADLVTTLRPETVQDPATGIWRISDPRKYVGQIDVGVPGTYTIVARFDNAGTATKWLAESDGTVADSVVPDFSRVFRQQITVR